MPRDTQDRIIARPTVRIGSGANLVDYPLLSEKVHRMEMREQTGGLSVLDLTLIDWISNADGRAGYGAVGSDQPLQLGAGIAIFAGDRTQPQEIFSGRITAIEGEVREEGAPLISVIAEDALFLARRTIRRRTFEDTSAADILRTIASDYRLTPEIRPGLDDTLGLWTQMNESDLAFLRRVLDAVDGDVQMVGETLQAGPRATEARNELTLSYPTDLVRARVTADLAKQVAAQTIAGFDPDTGQSVDARSFDSRLGPGRTPRDGATVIEQQYGPITGHIGFDGPLTQGEADLFADATFRTRARQFVTVDATTQGNPELRVGSWVTLTGLNPAFENTYCVTEACHRFDVGHGYRTDFMAESAYLGDAR